jgi:hypothetical protein
MRQIQFYEHSRTNGKDFIKKSARSDYELFDAGNGRGDSDYILRVSRNGEAKVTIKYNVYIKTKGCELKALVKKHKCVGVTLYYDTVRYLHK